MTARSEDQSTINSGKFTQTMTFTNLIIIDVYKYITPYIVKVVYTNSLYHG